MPKANESDIEEFKNDVTKLKIVFVEQMDIVLQHALAKNPFKRKKISLKKKKAKAKKTVTKKQ